MAKKLALAVAIWCACALAVVKAQVKEREPVWALKFQDFSVMDVFKGRPAQPILTKDNRAFRTRIRYGAAKGPNFAGHYTVVGWGCGAGCVANMLVDSATGRVYNMPYGSISMDAAERNYVGPVYQLKSRLFIADGCPNEGITNCGTYYYEWTANKFKLLRFDPQR
jgi:hypothetical protein